MKFNYDCDPVFFHSNRDMKNWIEINYPKAGFVEIMKLRKGYFLYDKIGKKISIDKLIIDKLSPHQSNFMGRFEDSNGFNFSYKQRLDFYYDILNYWNTIILRFKPQIFIAYTWPHLQSDYPLYLLCKFVYKIPIIFLDPYPHFNNRFAIMDDMTNRSLPFKKNYFKENIKITSEVKNFICNIREANYEIQPKHMANYFRYKSNTKVRMKNFFLFLKLLCTLKLFRDSNQSIKVRKGEWGNVKSQMSHLDLYLYKTKLMFGAYYLNFIYKRIAKQPDYKDKYFYFAAPYQPEASSSISTGIYENLYYTLNFICNFIPEDSFLYYKEHPSIFKDTEKGYLRRDKNFYLKIKNIKNLKIINSQIDNYTLIDKSFATISIAGTTPWLSLIRNKQTIVLGDHWVSSCKSVLNVNSTEEFKEAINKINKGFKIDEKDVEEYGQAIFDSTYPDLKVAGGRTLEAYGKHYKPKDHNDQEVKKICDALVRHYRYNFN